jgi:hypothetical protein
MKKLMFLTLLLLAYIGTQGQGRSIKSYDFNELQKKTLYIPKYSQDSEYVKELTKKGKFDKLKTLKEKTAYYNEIWTTAMANSSWDATPYEIRSYESKKLFKEKNEKAIILRFWKDSKTSNLFAALWVTGPKKQIIAQVPINGLHLDEEADIRLMINLLNYFLNMSLDLSEDEKKMKYKNYRSKYKESVIAFEENIENLTFLAPKYVESDMKKYEDRNEQIGDALKLWKICDYEWLTLDEIDDERAEGNPNAFYWKTIPIYSSVGLGVGSVGFVAYSMNFFLTCERDDVVFYWYGGKKMKADKATRIQEKIRTNAAKYRKELNIK